MKGLNMPWQAHIIEKDLYGDLPILERMISRRLKYVCHYTRAEEENRAISKILRLEPTYGKKTIRLAMKDYLKLLAEDAELTKVVSFGKCTIITDNALCYFFCILAIVLFGKYFFFFLSLSLYFYYSYCKTLASAFPIYRTSAIYFIVVYNVKWN